MFWSFNQLFLERYFIGEGDFIKRFFLLMIICLTIFAGCNYSEETHSEYDESNITEKKGTLTNNYDVSLKVQPDSNLIVGNEKVRFKNCGGKDAESLYFNLYLNSLDEENSQDDLLCFQEYASNVYKYGKDYGGINVLKVISDNNDLEFTVDKTVLCVKLKEPLKAGAEINLTINFEAKIPKICYKIGGNERETWVGSFLPTISGVLTDGSRNNKGFIRGLSFYDGFSNYSVNVSVPTGYNVIGSGIANVIENNNERIFSFNGNVIRDFAFVFGKDLKNKSLILDNGINLNFYYYSDEIDPEPIIQRAKECVEFITQKLGSYPYNEINFVETELYNDMCVNYPQVIFMDTNYIKDGEFQEDFCYTIAQQWIYNVIGADKVYEAWLCDGLACYLKDLMNNGDDFDSFISNRVDDFNKNLESLEIKKMNTPIQEFKTEKNYRYIENFKAEMMFYSLYKKIGNDDFQTFLKNLYSNYLFQGINKHKVIDAAKEYYSDSEQFFKEWTEGESLPEI